MPFHPAGPSQLSPQVLPPKCFLCFLHLGPRALVSGGIGPSHALPSGCLALSEETSYDRPSVSVSSGLGQSRTTRVPMATHEDTDVRNWPTCWRSLRSPTACQGKLQPGQAGWGRPSVPVKGVRTGRRATEMGWSWLSQLRRGVRPCSACSSALASGMDAVPLPGRDGGEPGSVSRVTAAVCPVRLPWGATITTDGFTC